eukprot:563106-Pyramimonas_sp.AAC.1
MPGRTLAWKARELRSTAPHSRKLARLSEELRSEGRSSIQWGRASDASRQGLQAFFAPRAAR